jgi:serine/threonine-protein kinase
MADDLEPGSSFAGYRVERLIGKGGMGAVYSAARIDDDAPVALKLVLDEHAAESRFLARFEREGRLAAGLTHPHLVEVYEAGTWEGVPFLAMALIEGIDLDYVLGTQGAIHPVTAARIIAEIASALDVAHAEGLVHRDVKPGNILLDSRDGVPHAYLADFGLSRHVDSTSGLTATGHWIGTIDYASPEQLMAATVDARTDVYALGCVLHKALTGSVPYPHERDVDKVMAHASGQPPAASEQVDSVPPELDEVVGRAMASKPAERYQSAGELGRAAQEAAAQAGPEPEEPIRFPVSRGAGDVDADAPTAG